MSGPTLALLRTYLAAHTQDSEGANVSLDALHESFSQWCRMRGHDAGSPRSLETAMGYAGFQPTRLDLGARGFRGLYISNSDVTPSSRDAGRPSGLSHHLTSLGLAGLHLEMVSGHVASLAARTATDTAMVGQYAGELENQSMARDAFRAELERVTGLPADLIERRLAL
jgi:hypothetical protein